jgi:hypothetical protein
MSQGLGSTKQPCSCTEALFPVCSPKLLRGRDALRTPGVLRRHVLLVAANGCETPRCGFMPLPGAVRAAPL